MLRFLLRFLQQVSCVCRFLRRSIEKNPGRAEGEENPGRAEGDEESEHLSMGFEPEEGPMTLAEALQKAEKVAGKANQLPNLDTALVLAKAEADHPAVGEAWRNFEGSQGRPDDPLFPSRRLASLVLSETSMHPEAVGHALVMAARGGHIRCVRRLREIQKDQLVGSMLVGLFDAFALLKAAEAGHADCVEELLSANTALMAYMAATRWKDTQGTAAYPYVEPPSNPPSQDWMRKLASCKSTLPPAGPIFQSGGGWDLRGLPGLHEDLHELVRAFYRTYLLWRASVVAASHCHAEVFRVLLNQRSKDNAELSKSLESMEMHSPAGKKGLDGEAKKLVADRAKMDTLLYQLVEEYSTKNYHDAMLYTLWGHIQRGGRDHPTGLGAGKPRCVAQAQNGIWEIQLEVPLLMMPVEYALKNEEPVRRFKQLMLLYPQRAKVNIQLLATVEAQPNFLQVTVAVKHVRFKAENSIWSEAHMGHFPTVVTLSVMPQAKDGSSVTMTNSSSNTTYKIGKAENISAGSGAGEGTTRGVGASLRATAGVAVSSTMKATPWRFEQLPLKDDRGGSFVWTLQTLKGIPFERSNPHRMAESASQWKWGRRIPGNPLDQLPFTSEGGVIFTGNEFSDTMMWRFPKSMEGKRLRWSIEGQIHSTFTTSRYYETRFANFCGDIEEKLTPMEDKKDKDKDKSEKKDKDKDKSEKKDKDKDKSEKKDKDKDKDKSEKKEKDKDKDKSEKGSKPIAEMDANLQSEFEEWLEFKRYKEQLQQEKNAKAKASTEPVIQAIPETDAAAPEQQQSEPGMSKKKMSLKLEVDQVPALTGRPSLQRAQGYKGRWLGSSDMEPLSPPVLDSSTSIGNYAGASLSRISTDSPGGASGRSDRLQRINGLSVRSVRTRINQSDFQRER